MYKESKLSGLKLKDVDFDKRIVAGYFAAFDIKDSDGDIFVKGAFERTIKERGPFADKPRIKHLLNHDPSQPVGMLLNLDEDDYGLFYVSQIGSHPGGEAFLAMVESGLITEHSNATEFIRQKGTARGNEVYEARMWEGSSLTGWGANMYTPLVPILRANKEAGLAALNLQLKSLEKTVKDSTATDDAIQLLIIQLKRLNQVIADLSTAPVVETEPPQRQEKQDDSINLLLKLNQSL